MTKISKMQGTNLVEIVLQMTGMVVQIVILRMVMAETEAKKRKGMAVHEEAAMGMEMEESQHRMKEEAIEIEPVHLIALIEEIALLSSAGANLQVPVWSFFNFIRYSVYCECIII